MISKNWWQSIIFIGLVLVLANICKAEEKYVRKELINFTWGAGDYQLGSNWRKYLDENGKYIGPADAWGENVGPSAIGINSLEEIYILDTGNRRILKYDKKGKFLNTTDPDSLFGGYVYSKNIGSDEQNNLYVVEPFGNGIGIFTPVLKHKRSIQYERAEVPPFLGGT